MPELRHFNSRISQVSRTFNHGVTDGNYVFLSGQLGADMTTSAIDRSSIEGETRTCLELLQSVLQEVGLGFEDVVRVNVYMTDLGQFDRMTKCMAASSSQDAPRPAPPLAWRSFCLVAL